MLHQLTNGGVPLFGLRDLNLPTGQGRQFYVDAENGSDTRDGRTPSRPLATISEALDRAEDGAGDVIFVFPGTYAENVIVNKDYVSIVRAIQGYGRPDIGPATGMALYVNGAQGVVLDGLRFFSEGAVPDLTATLGRLVRLEGNGFLVRDCVFDGSAGDHANSILLGLKGSSASDSYTASEGRILGSYFRGAVGRALAFETGEPPTNGVGVTDVEVIGNRFADNTGVDIINRASFAGGGAHSSKRCVIARNWFIGAKNKATWIDLTTSIDGAASDQDGLIAGNYFADDDLEGTNAVKITGTGYAFVGNYDSVGVQDGSGMD
jgi:hypothetical protein